MCSQKYSTQQTVSSSLYTFLYFSWATSGSIIHKLNTMKCFETPNETFSTFCSSSPTAEHQVNVRNYNRTKNVQMAKRYLCVRRSENWSCTLINTIIVIIVLKHESYVSLESTVTEIYGSYLLWLFIGTLIFSRSQIVYNDVQ